MNKVKLVLAAVMAVAIIWIGLFIYSKMKGVPMFEFLHRDNRMEQTATILRNITTTHQWIFLTVEDEEVVVRKHFIGDVAKIYPSYHELGIELDDSLKWVEIQENDGQKVANLHLPPIKILNDAGIDETKIVNIYGDADDTEFEEMKKEAQFKLKRRAMSDANIKQAEKNAKEHFENLFKALKCDSVAIEWIKNK